MRLILRIVGLVAITAAIGFGCKKQEAPAGSSVQVLDATKFRPAFASAPPETQRIVDNVMMSIQGSDFAKARSDLDRLSKMPGVTDAQQTIIKNLSDQLDKKIADIANAPK